MEGRREDSEAVYGALPTIRTGHVWPAENVHRLSCFCTIDILNALGVSPARVPASHNHRSNHLVCDSDSMQDVMQTCHLCISSCAKPIDNRGFLRLIDVQRFAKGLSHAI